MTKERKKEQENSSAYMDDRVLLAVTSVESAKWPGRGGQASACAKACQAVVGGQGSACANACLAEVGRGQLLPRLAWQFNYCWMP